MQSLSLFQKYLFGASGGFIVKEKSLIANISPSALALNLYYKCTGVNKSEKEFWGDSLVACDYDQAEIDETV